VDASCRIRIDEELGGLELVEASHPRPRFGRHAHATYAIGLVERGANRFRYRGAFHTAPAGALCTVTPDEPQEVEPTGDLGFAYRCLYPDADRLMATAEAVAGRRVRRTLALPPVIEDAVTARLVAALFAADRAGASPLERETRLVGLLARVTTRHALEPVTACERSLPAAGIARARDHLEAHLSRNVALAALASIAELDPFSLLRGFAKAYGLPPHAWLTQARVRRAQALLRAGSAPAEVAAAVGFADQSHLTRHFRRLLGYTPGRYLEAARGARRRPAGPR
jgi:AraC-like DNA-binding protein